MEIIVFVSFSLIVTIVILFLYFSNQVLNKPASNNPDNFIKNKSSDAGKVLVTLGDSITHGAVSANYSNLIKKHMEQYAYTTVNAGMNADLAITALRKIEKVIACKPDIVTILLGTNDVLASQGEKERKNYLKFKRLKKNDEVSLNFYEQSLRSIVGKLKDSGLKHIFLISLPLIGENLTQDVNEKTLSYSRVIKSIADSEKVNYVPLNETMRDIIKKSGGGNKFSKEGEIRSYPLIARHYFFGANLDELHKSYGYQFLTEGVHLNSVGGGLVSSLIIKAFDQESLLV